MEQIEETAAGHGYHHVAGFVLRPEFALRHVEICDELRVRLEAFREYPGVLALTVHVAARGTETDRRGGTGPDVVLDAVYDDAAVLARLRADPTHRALIAWYDERFDDSLRTDHDSVLP